MVLGHSRCGACQAAIDHIGDNTALPGWIEGMVDYIRPIVNKVKDAPGDQLVNVTMENARVNARRLANLAPILPGMVENGELKSGPSGFVVDSIEFSAKENHYARQRTVPTNSWTFVTLDRC